MLRCLVVNMIATIQVVTVMGLLVMETMSKSAHRHISPAICRPYPCEKHEDCDWRRCEKSREPQAPRCQTSKYPNATCCVCSNQNDRYLPAEEDGKNPSLVEYYYEYP